MANGLMKDKTNSYKITTAAMLQYKKRLQVRENRPKKVTKIKVKKQS